MSNRLVLWSGGGRFVASKDVQSAAIVPFFRIKVDWGGEIEYLDGNTWTLSTVTEWEEIAVVNSPVNLHCLTSGYGRGDTGASNLMTKRWRGKLINSNGGVATSSPRNANTRWAVRWAVPRPIIICSAQDGWNNVIYERSAATPEGGGWTTSSVSGITILSKSGSLHTAVIEQENVKKRITSNLGYFSERETATNPTVSLVQIDCAIAITYTDQTTQQIPVSPCPTWVQVKPANSCPENTCHECTHDGEKCCYARGADGNLVLIDRFHLTS